ncbi:ATP-binding protein [Vallitalea guaymasensis]|uniref:Sensor histidine kinase n=1 Tax=Vallitalea guaymasensis TaxID=1185412 RepID=A0A8J8MEW9_9FIRM|nr:ATP-binding protein [Vallitalea guaymasensis]QUH31543.1 sensor histidine kinase [Vallitalea guaymasensis]
MKELSMHILDIAQNSIRADANIITIIVKELIKDNIFEFSIKDNGTGIDEEILKDIRNPFTTSRTMRRVGLGIPLLDNTCNICNGRLEIDSSSKQGTYIKASMDYNHIDRPPIGDMVATMATLISSNGDIDIQYKHYYNENSFDITTKELKEVLGDEVPLTNLDVIKWLKEFLKENINELKSDGDKS